MLALALVFRALMIARIRTAHETTWRELGCPDSLELGMWEKSSRKTTWYLWTGKWTSSRDFVLIFIGIANVAVAIAAIFLLYVQLTRGF